MTEQKNIKNKEKFQNFITTVANQGIISFKLKKCGKADCNICKPLKSDEVDFFQVHSLPDPIPTIDKTSYKEFSEIYGTITTETVSTFIKTPTERQTNKQDGFSPNAQFAKIFGVVVECYESDTEVSNNNDDYESDNLSEIFEKVKINNSLTCNSPMEIPYYSSGLFEDICFSVGKIPEEGDEESNNQVNIEEGYYYYCNECYITVDSKKEEIGKLNYNNQREGEQMHNSQYYVFKPIIIIKCILT
ncbi:hypothetical protein GLOIN_2v1489433 [Rhizophagus clarus]|nr:hypothetical protein GLOIN_2v1489433 [Rhizophagus clarus]